MRPHVPTSHEELQEWAGFLALHASFDTGEIDGPIYERVLLTLRGFSARGRITRQQLQVHAGLSFGNPDAVVDVVLAKLIQEDVLEPIVPLPFHFRILPQPSHSDSAYACEERPALIDSSGDERQALIDAACSEQLARLQTIGERERCLARSGPGKSRSRRFEEDLRRLREVYRAAWIELEHAVGEERGNEARNRIERSARVEDEQLPLFP